MLPISESGTLPMTVTDAAWKLVIFDCDGVLVDSEIIGIHLLVEAAKTLGVEFSLGGAIALFRGIKMTECIRAIEDRLGCAVPATFETDYRARCAAAFASKLRAIPGIEAALDHISVPVCVASGSPREKIEHTLKLTGLESRFRGRIFSSYEVGAWKPAPGLFLHAAQAMGVAPAECVVVEDSLVGIQAAVAAGMTAFGYADPPYADVLQANGAHVFSSLLDLPYLLDSARQTRSVKGSTVR
jgi:HAD superfamily hydrolase (TIGR01509 family)